MRFIGAHNQRRTGRRARAAFTIVELLVAISVLAILLSLLFVAGKHVLRITRRAAAQQTVNALKTAVEQFKGDFGFLPPLVADQNPGVAPVYPGYPTYYNAATQKQQAAVFNFSLEDSNSQHREFLRGVNATPDAMPGDRRFSTFSLSYYLGGMGDVPYGAGNPRPLMDGVEGGQFLKPDIDGSFASPSGGRTGKKYGPYFDTSKQGLKTLDQDMAAGMASTGRVQLLDRKGVPIRYYRWMHGQPNSRTTSVELNGQFMPTWLNVPQMVDDPALRGDTVASTEMRDAEFAIVAAGPDGIFGDFASEAGGDATELARLCRELGIDPASTVLSFRKKATEDNVVEVGR